MGFDWGERLTHASDYFDQLYAYAVELIKQGKAYVCHLDAEQIRAYRGTLTQPGKESPWRNRSVDENLEQFEKMRKGEYEEGACVLRAKIDMASPNINLRDPAIYRIRKVPHQRTGDKWMIYPMYDYTHCLSDALEGITHSLCTLEFEDHRPLYDWVLDQLNTPCHPQQIEFARLALEYTVMSKRKLKQLVDEQFVLGWDDPRMPTLKGLRRRGYTAASIREFCRRIGITKSDSFIEMAALECVIREDLDRQAERRLCVQHPLKLVILNYPEDQEEWVEGANHPGDPERGKRKIPFSRELYIEREDFMEIPPKKYHRLSPGAEVRLRFAYFVTCEAVIHDPDTGDVSEIHCRYDPLSKGGTAHDGRKVKGTIHWVSAKHAVDVELRCYSSLFTLPDPEAGEGEYTDYINPDSLQVIHSAKGEPALAEAMPETRFQFERIGYFCADRVDHRPDHPVYNLTVGLRDSWAKQSGKSG
jgi:glutaminyl-tRNA synthetase